MAVEFQVTMISDGIFDVEKYLETQNSKKKGIVLNNVLQFYT